MLPCVDLRLILNGVTDCVRVFPHSLSRRLDTKAEQVTRDTRNAILWCFGVIFIPPSQSQDPDSIVLDKST